MRISTIAILAALGCALGIVAWIVLWNGSDPLPNAEVAVPSPDESIDAMNRSHLLDPMSPLPREEATFEAPAAAPPESVASSEAASASEIIASAPPTPDPDSEVWRLPSFAPRERIADWVFEQKYAETDREGRTAALAAVAHALRESKEGALDARREAGLFVPITVTPGRPFQFEADGELPLWRAFKTASSNEFQVVVIPPQEYPEVYALRDEMFWLQGHSN